MLYDITFTRDTRWHEILDNGTKGWGVDTLR